MIHIVHLHGHGGLQRHGGVGRDVRRGGDHAGAFIQLGQGRFAGLAVLGQVVVILEALHGFFGILAEDTVDFVIQVSQLRQPALELFHVLAPVAHLQGGIGRGGGRDGGHGGEGGQERGRKGGRLGGRGRLHQGRGLRWLGLRGRRRQRRGCFRGPGHYHHHIHQQRFNQIHVFISFAGHNGRSFIERKKPGNSSCFFAEYRKFTGR